MGAGVSVLDVDKDGRKDLFFASNMGKSALYLNKGKFKFEDISDKALSDLPNNCWIAGSSVVDINNDGYDDLYLCVTLSLENIGSSENILLVNNRDGTFSNKAAEYGLNDSSRSVQAVFFDFDQDEDLDCYVVNLPEHNVMDYFIMTSNYDISKSDHLYENVEGKFRELTLQKALNNYAFGSNAIVADFDNDAHGELYVSNDFDKGDLYWDSDQPDKNLKQIFGHSSFMGMGTDAADLNNDGWIDLIDLDIAYTDPIANAINRPMIDAKRAEKNIREGHHYQYIKNCLQINNGSGFNDIAHLAGINESGWAWCPLILDMNNDGLKDIFISNGQAKNITDFDLISEENRIVVDSLQQDPRYINNNKAINELRLKIFKQFYQNYQSIPTQNLFFLNQGDLEFKSANDEFTDLQKSISYGAAYADLDNDGDLDLITNNLDQKASILKNNSRETNKNNYLKIRLIGPEKNQKSIGSSVCVYTADGFQKLELYPTRGYLSTSDTDLNFGLDKTRKIDSIIVQWPDQSTTVLKKSAINTLKTIEYNKVSRKFNTNPAKPSIFKAKNPAEMGFKMMHQDTSFKFLEEHPLAMLDLGRMSNFPVAVDMDQDGTTDLLLPGGPGQSTQLLLQQSSGFVESPQIHFDRFKAQNDLVLYPLDSDKDKDLDLLVFGGRANDGTRIQNRYYINEKGRMLDASGFLPDIKPLVQTIVSADIDQDGDLDLFVGGRMDSAQYPLAVGSYLLINEKGRFVDKTSTFCPELMDIGMVSSALLQDIDQDGLPDLILVGEWMPLRIFINKKNKFEALPTDAQSNGLWFSLKASDLDNDGDLDLIAGNLGRNSVLECSAEDKLYCLSKDFDQNGSSDLLLCKKKNGTFNHLHRWDAMMKNFPILQKKYKSLKKFLEADVAELFGKEPSDAQQFEVSTLSSTIFLNDGKGNFKMQALPLSCQYAPILDIHVDDFNNDNIPDLMTVGNYHDVSYEYDRMDASSGNILLGKGDGTFEALPAYRSGFYANGNTRGITKFEIGEKNYFLISVNNGKNLIFEQNP